MSMEGMRDAIEKLLVGVDLTTTTIGSLRAALETSLGMKAGSLDPRKAEVNGLITEVISEAQQGKRQATEPADAPAAKKEKKEKKDKAEKKEKKDKKDKKAKKETDVKQEPVEQSATLEGESVQPRAEAEAPAAIVEEAPLPAEAPVAWEGDASATKEPPINFDAAPNAAVDDSFFGIGDSMFADFTDEVMAEGKEPTAVTSAATSRIWAVSGAEDGTLRLWNLEGYSCHRVIEAHSVPVSDIVADFREMRCLSGAADGCKLWDLRRGTCLRTYPVIQGGCLRLACRRFRDGMVVCGGGDGSIHTWKASTGETAHTTPSAHPGGVWALDVSWERRRAATGGDVSFKVWNMEDWSCLQKVEDHPGGIMSLSVDWAGNRVLVAAGICGKDPRMLRMWDLDSKEAQMLSGCEDTAANLEVNWAKGIAVTGGWDAKVRTWNTQECLCTHATRCDFGRVRSITVDFESQQVLCGSSAGMLYLLDLRTDRVLQTLEGHVGGVTVVRASFS